MSDRCIPVLVRDRDGAVGFVGVGNEKSVAKSVERREVWLVQPYTGRVLPLGDPAVAVEEIQKQRESSLALWAEFKTKLTAEQLSDARSRYALELQRTQARPAASTASGSPEQTRSSTASRDDAGPATKSGSAPGALQEEGAIAGDILNHLAVTIHERRQHRPEGSYTTHLFEKGEEKIRKKLGEEAVEVLLAPSNKELTYEAADLIFHLMVLLEVRGLSVDDVADELRERF